MNWEAIFWLAAMVVFIAAEAMTVTLVSIWFAIGALGAIVVALLGDEATVKRLRRRNGQVWLMPENENYEPIDGTNAQLIGLVKAVVREY